MTCYFKFFSIQTQVYHRWQPGLQNLCYGKAKGNAIDAHAQTVRYSSLKWTDCEICSWHDQRYVSEWNGLRRIEPTCLVQDEHQPIVNQLFSLSTFGHTTISWAARSLHADCGQLCHVLKLDKMYPMIFPLLALRWLSLDLSNDCSQSCFVQKIFISLPWAFCTRPSHLQHTHSMLEHKRGPKIFWAWISFWTVTILSRWLVFRLHLLVSFEGVNYEDVTWGKKQAWRLLNPALPSTSQNCSHCSPARLISWDELCWNGPMKRSLTDWNLVACT